ncbi:MAG: hypothetical protein U0904_11415 [Candidatus Nanopelagicales bacterium]|nr:hypothetical protein [Candidatus Nanopelagicales bacterium]
MSAHREVDPPAGRPVHQRSLWQVALASGFALGTVLLGWYSVYLAQVGRAEMAYYHSAPAMSDGFVATVSLVGSGVAGALSVVCLWNAIRFANRFIREPVRWRSLPSGALASGFILGTILLGLYSAYLAYHGRARFLDFDPMRDLSDDSIAMVELVGSGVAGTLSVMCLWNAIRFTVRFMREPS